MIDIIATILSILGAIINAQEKIEGFYIWIVSNVLWTIYCIDSNQIPLGLTFIVYIGISAYGIKEWRKNEKQKTDKRY